MKFSNYALAAAVFASTANAFAGSQMTPRFGLQVRPTKTAQRSIFQPLYGWLLVVPCILYFELIKP
jgi:hypothetical protein